jgi:hypothetical protein
MHTLNIGVWIIIWLQGTIRPMYATYGHEAA